MSCPLLAGGNTFDCTDRLKGGVNQRLLLGNISEIASVTQADNVISALTMQTGARLWAFDGLRDSLQPRTVFVPGTNQLGYDHQIDFLAYGVSAADRLQLDKLAFGDIFGIVENGDNSSLGDAFFEVFGFEMGLETITDERVNASAETNGAYAIQLKTPDRGGKEDGKSLVFFDTDYATTKALVDALLIPA